MGFFFKVLLKLNSGYKGLNTGFMIDKSPLVMDIKNLY